MLNNILTKEILNTINNYYDNTESKDNDTEINADILELEQKSLTTIRDKFKNLPLIENDAVYFGATDKSNCYSVEIMISNKQSLIFISFAIKNTEMLYSSSYQIHESNDNYTVERLRDDYNDLNYRSIVRNIISNIKEMKPSQPYSAPSNQSNNEPSVMNNINEVKEEKASKQETYSEEKNDNPSASSRLSATLINNNRQLVMKKHQDLFSRLRLATCVIKIIYAYLSQIFNQHTIAKDKRKLYLNIYENFLTRKQGDYIMSVLNNNTTLAKEDIFMYLKIIRFYIARLGTLQTLENLHKSSQTTNFIRKIQEIVNLLVDLPLPSAHHDNNDGFALDNSNSQEIELASNNANLGQSSNPSRFFNQNNDNNQPPENHGQPNQLLSNN